MLSPRGGSPVDRMGFGAMWLTGYGPARDPDAMVRLARRAVELGAGVVDTADGYGLGANEELLAKALHPYPDGVLVATKVGQVRSAERKWQPLGRPAYLRQQTELSLRRLRVDTLDLLQLHRIDPTVPVEDQLGTLAELQQEGKARHIGLSEVTADQLEAARGHARIASVQNRYNLTDREHEGVLEHCEREGIAFIPWWPLARGEHALRQGPIGRVADELGATPAQVCLAWLLRRSPVVHPIPGTKSLAHLDENMAARTVELDDRRFRELDALAPAAGK
ncbi:aryl-alcohol dehydrogenase-like predicted oxidoreductase [Umezawaea tangerina]|uniref:Aryl-alcohol dehydrogenase-like predicted oxidoreductase n=2 Tax=Umezawaea tangerina TaxID=84725 RepID=A0A2T0T6I2_9PSEU|nr:aryl-alcohol dehydrogenase-like predicted oxidoreductase [Umezawaea tangerina]